MKNRIIVIEHDNHDFIGLECEDGSVIDLNYLTKGKLVRYFSVKENEKFDVLVADITDF